MNTINLLPPTERQPRWPINKILFIVTILFFLIYSIMYSYNAFTVLTMKKELQRAHNQYELLQPTAKLMRMSNNKQQLIDKKNNIVTLLTKERVSSYTAIQHLVSITPQQMWFTDLTRTDKDTMQIKGSAVTYSIVAKFIENIEQDPFFTAVSLNKVENNITAPLIKFEIMVKFKGM